MTKKRSTFSNRRLSAVLAVFVLGFLDAAPAPAAPASLEGAWENPPMEARLRAYWWWLNGNVTKAAITHDLEEMRAKGFGGAIITDAGGPATGGNETVPAGPMFGSPEWRELYRHTLREADRLGLTMGLNIQSGWNVGGPGVKPEDAAKVAVWSETAVDGPKPFAGKLPVPAYHEYFRDVSVVAWREKPATKNADAFGGASLAAALKLPPAGPKKKAALDTGFLTPGFPRAKGPAAPGEEETVTGDVLDLTSKLEADGTLRWDVPAGRWNVLRVGSAVGPGAHVSTSSPTWQGFSVDVLNKEAFRHYWDAVVTPLIDDAGPLAGKSLKYLHTDSWEIEPYDWTAKMPEEFLARRGYDLKPWLPVLAGHIVNSREASQRFADDVRQTLADLAVDNHYKPYLEWAHARGLQIHPESGGPHVAPYDAQRCLGINDVPMSEFWAWSWTHRIGDANRFFVKQPASAAHTAGHPLVFAEGFTDIGPHWQESLWSNLKPAFDKACTEGLNVLVWHAFVCSPDSMGTPGQQYFAGTHLNPKATWWSRGGPFFAYIDRCQTMLQRGLPVSDVLYYLGDEVPNFAGRRDSDPAKVGAGYDYDVISKDALLARVSVKDGLLMLPEGTTYRLLVLPDDETISLPVLRKVRELVEAGATIVGVKPGKARGLNNAATADAEVNRLAETLWNSPQKGRPIVSQTGREALAASGVKPDFAFAGGSAKAEVSYIHRRDGDAEIYFVASRGEATESLRCTFRVAGKAPELWDPKTGGRRLAAAYETRDGLTTLPLDFDPCGSVFVVFRAPAGQPAGIGTSNTAAVVARGELSGPWTLAFDPQWGGPAEAVFDKLESWTVRGEAGIRNFSGTATYRKTFDLPAGLKDGSSLFLDLGDVRELAEVRLNGQSLGVVWTPPFRVEISHAVKPAGNRLEVDVVNFWPNRILGDAALPPEKRLTKTNVSYSPATELMVSGLLGPVRVMEVQP